MLVGVAGCVLTGVAMIYCSGGHWLCDVLVAAGLSGVGAAVAPPSGSGRSDGESVRA